MSNLSDLVAGPRRNTHPRSAVLVAVIAIVIPVVAAAAGAASPPPSRSLCALAPVVLMALVWPLWSLPLAPGSMCLPLTHARTTAPTHDSTHARWEKFRAL